jgi:hypothetical protein
MMILFHEVMRVRGARTRRKARKKDGDVKSPLQKQERRADGRSEEPIGISAFPGRRRTRWPASADEWIDLVGDPIIFENNGKERS